MGRPALTSVPSVRVKRATATSRSSAPSTGTRSSRPSKRRRLAGCEIHRRQPIVAPAPARITSSHHVFMKAANPSRMRVGSGSTMPGWLAMGAISCGRITVTSSTTLARINPATIMG